ncbi:site-specific DNA-methyltransferase [Patescibacteria group bacterium]|nr:MAG: site-specific DNA-methyltransferase [Patescibacteria group bacterium]
MEFNYEGKESKDSILKRAHAHRRIEVDPGNSLLIKGDNFDVLSSMLESGYSEKIDLIYIDPPFNTKQSYTVGESRVSTISRGPKSHIAYSDHMSTQDYLEFMRERFVILRELLSKQGSIYVHIDNKMGHYLKIILDEVFGIKNFKNDITRIKSNPKNFTRKAFGNQKDMILFYSKDFNKNIFNNVSSHLDEADVARMFKKIDKDGRRYNTVPVHAPGETANGSTGGLWRDMMPPEGRHWRTDPVELEKLDKKGLIEWSKNGVPRIKKYADEHTGKKLQDIWNYIDPAYPLYPTEKNLEMLKMIILQSSNKNSTVLDCFAGSGSTLFAASTLGRTWIGIDQSDYSIKVIKNRFKGVQYDYLEYKLH